MKGLKAMTIALLALFALGGVAASAAQAEEEAPFWSIEAARLKAAEFEPFTLRSEEGGLTRTKKFTLTSEAGEVVTCTKQTLAVGAKLIGSGVGNPGTSEETFQFSGCTVEKNGAGCTVEGEKFNTATLLNELVLDPKKKFAQILFKPVTGTVFATIKFAGAGCTFKETKVEGEVVGELWTDPPEAKEEEKALEALESEKVQAKSLLVKFPAKPIRFIWLINEGVGKEVEVKQLKAFVVPCTVSGTSLMAVGTKLFSVLI